MIYHVAIRSIDCCGPNFDSMCHKNHFNYDTLGHLIEPMWICVVNSWMQTRPTSDRKKLHVDWMKGWLVNISVSKPMRWDGLQWTNDIPWRQTDIFGLIRNGPGMHRGMSAVSWHCAIIPIKGMMNMITNAGLIRQQNKQLFFFFLFFYFEFRSFMFIEFEKFSNVVSAEIFKCTRERAHF